ncbi:MAG TPA: RidA family protein [Chloroflexota bacterium]|jgi:enamine deaminase RidA (YjgF/YER057c/UK114 family)
MRLTLLTWRGHEFIALTGEGDPALGAADATRDLLTRCDARLQPYGLSLDDTVRTRLFTRDRPGRDAASVARRERLSGRARSVSSSFIAPDRLDSAATLALDLLALRPSRPGTERSAREYEPPRAPLRSLTTDGLVFLSGVTSSAGALAEQVAVALAEIGESLTTAGSGWDRVVLTSCFLHTSQDASVLLKLLPPALRDRRARIECEPVDGYASPGCLVEIEVTATL